MRFSGGHLDDVYNFKSFKRCFSHRESKSFGCQMLKDRHDSPYQLRSLRIVIADGEDPMQMQKSNVRKSNEQKLTSILGGVGLALLLVITIVAAYFFVKYLNRWIQRAIKNHSFSSTSVVWLRVSRSTNAVSPSPQQVVKNLSQFTLSNLAQCTRNFDKNNVVGQGTNGTVYKGLLEDGSIVAVKKLLCSGAMIPTVKKLPRLSHKHLVNLVGFCQENHQQFIVSDYISNGNVATHLYGLSKLDMNKRLLIAIGAAKGLEHLHRLFPPVLHMNFTTRNVLLDDNFIAKVSDYGFVCLSVDNNNALPSSAMNCFLDTELESFKNFTEKSDVYSFGVFMLELISGREAWSKNSKQEQSGNLLQQAKGVGSGHIEDFVDETLKINYPMGAMKKMLGLALLCVDASSGRPSMKKIVEELEAIRKEMRNSSGAIDIGNVALGSDLFSSSFSVSPQSPLS